MPSYLLSQSLAAIPMVVVSNTPIHQLQALWFAIHADCMADSSTSPSHHVPLFMHIVHNASLQELREWWSPMHDRHAIHALFSDLSAYNGGQPVTRAIMCLYAILRAAPEVLWLPDARGRTVFHYHAMYNSARRVLVLCIATVLREGQAAWFHTHILRQWKRALMPIVPRSSQAPDIMMVPGVSEPFIASVEGLLTAWANLQHHDNLTDTSKLPWYAAWLGDVPLLKAALANTSVQHADGLPGFAFVGGGLNPTHRAQHLLLWLAVVCGHANAVQVLLEHGVRPHEDNLLYLAAVTGNSNLVEALLRHSTSTASLHFIALGQLPLTCSAIHGDLRMFRALCAHGADACNPFYLVTSLQHAVLAGHRVMVQHLLQRGVLEEGCKHVPKLLQAALSRDGVHHCGIVRDLAVYDTRVGTRPWDAAVIAADSNCPRCFQAALDQGLTPLRKQAIADGTFFKDAESEPGSESRYCFDFIRIRDRVLRKAGVPLLQLLRHTFAASLAQGLLPNTYIEPTQDATEQQRVHPIGHVAPPDGIFNCAVTVAHYNKLYCSDMLAYVQALRPQDLQDRIVGNILHGLLHNTAPGAWHWVEALLSSPPALSKWLFDWESPLFQRGDLLEQLLQRVGKERARLTDRALRGNMTCAQQEQLQEHPARTEALNRHFNVLTQFYRAMARSPHTWRLSWVSLRTYSAFRRLSEAEKQQLAVLLLHTYDVVDGDIMEYVSAYHDKTLHLERVKAAGQVGMQPCGVGGCCTAAYMRGLAGMSWQVWKHNMTPMLGIQDV